MSSPDISGFEFDHDTGILPDPTMGGTLPIAKLFHRYDERFWAANNCEITTPFNLNRHYNPPPLSDYDESARHASVDPEFAAQVGVVLKMAVPKADKILEDRKDSWSEFVSFLGNTPLSQVTVSHDPRFDDTELTWSFGYDTPTEGRVASLKTKLPAAALYAVGINSASALLDDTVPLAKKSSRNRLGSFPPGRKHDELAGLSPRGLFQARLLDAVVGSLDEAKIINGDDDLLASTLTVQAKPPNEFDITAGHLKRISNIEAEGYQKDLESFCRGLLLRRITGGLEADAYIQKEYLQPAIDSNVGVRELTYALGDSRMRPNVAEFDVVKTRPLELRDMFGNHSPGRDYPYWALYI